MKVTVDTRHDSLEEALATVRAAFGSNGNRRDATRTTAGGNARVTKGTGSGQRAAGPGARRSPAKRAMKNASEPPATTTSGRNGRKRVGPTNPTSNVAPPGQADAIRAWAKAQGMEVKHAGRLPAVVIQAYQERPHHD
jgi:hypothetical protein